MLPPLVVAVVVRLIALYVGVIAIGHVRFFDGAVNVALTGNGAYGLLAAIGALGAVLGGAALSGLWRRRAWGGWATVGWAAATVARDVAFVLATSPEDPIGILLFAPRWVALAMLGGVALRFAAPRPRVAPPAPPRPPVRLVPA